MSSHRHPPRHRCRPCHHRRRLIIVIIVSPWHLPWASCRCRRRSWGGVIIVVVDDAGHGVDWWVAVASSLVVVLVVVVIPSPSSGRVVVVRSPPPSCPSSCLSPLSSLSLSSSCPCRAGWWWGCPHHRHASLPHCHVDAGKGGWGRRHHACLPHHCRHRCVVEVVVTVVCG